MKCNGIRESVATPDYALLHPGYDVNPIHHFEELQRYGISSQSGYRLPRFAHNDSVIAVTNHPKDHHREYRASSQGAASRYRLIHPVFHAGVYDRY